MGIVSDKWLSPAGPLIAATLVECYQFVPDRYDRHGDRPDPRGFPGYGLGCLHELLADTPALQPRLDHQHAELALHADEFKMRAANDLSAFDAQEDNGSLLGNQVLDVRLVGSRAVQQIGLGGSALLARFAAIGGIYQGDNRLRLGMQSFAK